MISTTDECEIIAVLTRYATGVDRRDWPLLRACFAENFIGDYGSFGSWRGPDEITKFMEEVHASVGPTLHRMSNFVIDGEGDHATARSYVDALLMPGTPDGEVHQAAGWYEDEFTRTEHGWKIRRRRFVAVRMT